MSKKKKIISNDGLESMVTGMGTERDKKTSTEYVLNHLNKHQLETAYRTSWIARKIVEQKPKDALRNWRNWQADQDQIAKIKLEEKRLNLQVKYLEAAIQGALFGGSAIYLKTKQDPEEPLDPSKVQAGEIEYAVVLSCYDLHAEQYEQDITQPNYGRPTYYQIHTSTENTRIHYSHLAIFYGNQYPDTLRTSSGVGSSGNSLHEWSDSVLQVVYEACKNADSTISNVATMVFEANVDVIKIPDFMDSLSDDCYEQTLMKRWSLAALAKGVHKLLVTDKEDEYERKAINFSNIPEVMEKFLIIASAAAGIPYTKFMSQSASGMNATGEGDSDNYNDEISVIQSLVFQPCIALHDECLIRSSLGSRPESLEYIWSPLDQPSAKEVAEIGEIQSKTTKNLVDTGLYSPEVLQEATTNALVQSGAFAGLDNIVERVGAELGEDFDLGEDAEDQNN